MANTDNTELTFFQKLICGIIMAGIFAYVCILDSNGEIQHTKIQNNITIRDVFSDYVIDQKWKKTGEFFDTRYMRLLPHYKLTGKVKIKNKLVPFEMSFVKMKTKNVLKSSVDTVDLKLGSKSYDDNAARAFLDTCYEEYMKDHNKN